MSQGGLNHQAFRPVTCVSLPPLMAWCLIDIDTLSEQQGRYTLCEWDLSLINGLVLCPPVDVGLLHALVERAEC
jgi:hypothetical protein